MKPGSGYFRFCQAMFIFACTVGTTSALSYLNLVPGHGWVAWRPLLGIALLFASMMLSFIGYARTFQAGSQPSSSPAAGSPPAVAPLPGG